MPLFQPDPPAVIDNVADSEVNVINSVLSRTAKKRFRDDFSGTALSSSWSVLQAGSGGQTVSVISSELNVTTGVTASSEIIIRSVDTYRIPFRIFVVLKLSQRIANQEFYLEVVDGTGQHYAQWLFDGTNAQVAKAIAANGGSSIGSSSAAPANTSLYQIFELELGTEEINYYYRATDSSSASRSGLTRTRQIPDPTLDYYIQIRTKNLATAPASVTTFTLDSIVIQQTEEFAAEIVGARGGGNVNESLPVLINGTPAITISQAASTSILTVADVQISNVETAVALAASVTFGGNNRDSCISTVNNAYRNVVRGWVFTDQNGTLIVEQSTNNSTFRQTHSINVIGNATSATLFEFKLYSRYFRVKYINGSTAQTVLEIVATQFAIGA